MIMNEEVYKGSWKQIKAEVQNTCGKLSEYELERTGGDVKAIMGLVEQRHGEGREMFQSKFTIIMERFSHRKKK